jgi:hypothetical protein
VFEKLHSLSKKELSLSLSLSQSIDRSISHESAACMHFEEIFSIRQCDGELCGENSMHAQKRKASMTAAATAFQQRVVSKESSLDDACMIWHHRQL